MRADAVRNRQKIVEVASELMDDVGAQFSMDAVAKAARVGAGTLYRHFPTRELLIAEIINTRHTDLPAVEELLAQTSTAREALRIWISILWGWMRSYESLTQPLLEAGENNYSSPLGVHCSAIITNMDHLIKRAQEEGDVREDVTGMSLYHAVLGLAWASKNLESADSLLILLEKGWSV